MELKFSGGLGLFLCFGVGFMVVLFSSLFPAPISKEEMSVKTLCMPDCSLGNERLVYRLLCARLKRYKLVQVHCNSKRQGCRGEQCKVFGNWELP